MNDEFAARRAAARKRLDAIDPAKNPNLRGRLDDPYRRDWFRAVYDLAAGDEAAVPWADKQAHPLLVELLTHPSPLWGGGREISLSVRGDASPQDSATPHPNPPPQGGREQIRPLANLRALDVGCGLGDNAEALAAAGAETTALDLSENAIVWAKRRFPDTRVDYRAGDLFHPPSEWRGAFDLVHECYTLQALPNALLPEAGRALASFLKPGGALLVIARSRPNPAAPEGPPWPLARRDIDALAAHGLSLETCEELTSPSEPAHWRAIYRRAA